MNKTILIFSFLFFSILVYGQTQNGSFENWEYIWNGSDSVYVFDHWNFEGTDINTTRIRPVENSSDGHFGIEVNAKKGENHSNIRFNQVIRLEEPLEKGAYISFDYKSYNDFGTGEDTRVSIIYCYADSTEIALGEKQLLADVEDYHSIILDPIPEGTEIIIIEILSAISKSHSNMYWFDNFRINTNSTLNYTEDYIEKLSFYPNPSSGMVHFNTEMNTIKQIQLLDITGKCYRSFPNESSIYIENEGQYLVRLIHNDGTITTLKQPLVILR